MNSLETSVVKTVPGSQHAYDELSTLSLRLFRLEKAASGGLSIQLSTFAMDGDLPDYVALSYTWEPRFPLHVVQVNGGELSIGHNIWEALWTLVPLRGTFFWTDQVCINQQRTHELNHQVGLMHQIYHLARTVLIWLGSADQGSNDAMQFISYIAAGNCDRPSDMCKCKHIKRMDDAVERTCSYHFEYYQSGEMAHGFKSSIERSIKELFQRRYWSRVWVVQEIMFARNVLIQCGNWTITWADLQLFFSWTTHPREHEWMAYPFTMHGTALRPANFYPPSFRTIIEMKQVWGLKDIWTSATQDLLDILKICDQFECKLIVDRIYGLLGLVQIGERLDVDYDLTPFKLFIAVLHHVVKNPLEDESLTHKFGWKLWQALECRDSGMTYHQGMIIAFPGLIDLYNEEWLVGFNFEYDIYAKWVKWETKLYESRLLRQETRLRQGKKPRKLKPRYKELEPAPTSSYYCSGDEQS